MYQIFQPSLIIANSEPPLKAKNPNIRIKPPKTVNGTEWPGISCGFTRPSIDMFVRINLFQHSLLRLLVKQIFQGPQFEPHPNPYFFPKVFHFRRRMFTPIWSSENNTQNDPGTYCNEINSQL